MTLAEYELRMEAYQLQEIERDKNLAYQAWLNQQVQAVENDGETPVYKDWKSFFNEQKEIDKVRTVFEADYQPTTAKREEIEAEVEKASKPKHSEQDEILARIREYQKLHPRKRGN